jgi:dsRNA-specific ribonuclease
VSVGGTVLGTGVGPSQKSAEIAAAEAALPGLREGGSGEHGASTTR